MKVPLLSVRIRDEQDVVNARQRARQVAQWLGFDSTEQTRIATAVSEIARNAFAYAGGGNVDFVVEGAMPPQLLTIVVSDRGPGIEQLDDVMTGRYRSPHGMGLGIVGTRRLMDQFDVRSDTHGTRFTLKKLLPRRSKLVGPA